jgi:hypothetical protein
MQFDIKQKWPLSTRHIGFRYFLGYDLKILLHGNLTTFVDPICKSEPNPAAFKLAAAALIP